MKFTPTTQVSGGIFLHGGETRRKMGIICLGPCWLSLVVSHPRTPILNGFAYSFWAYFLTDSEFSRLAVLAKPYPVSGPTYMPHIPNLLHCMSKCTHECWRLVLRPH